ncbi:radical SAM protein [Clostridiales bacterium COT073_COT-073]|nr:radical SAM protein [Clostridiales bacterium COT073_COT-073]
MYQLSNYISEFKTISKLVLVSLKTGNLLILSDQAYIEEYQKIKHQNRLSSINTQLEAALYSSGFITLTPEDLSSHIGVIKNKMKKALKIIILPTEKCNFRCAYCYESFKHGKMSSTYINAIKNFLKKKLSTGNFTELHLNWFGGEPLLEVQVIKEIQSYALELCLLYNINISSNITTNGYLLDISLFQELLDLKINIFQITIDGENHDQKRVLISGKPTYQKIISNLKEIQKSSEKYQIILRNNILTDQFDESFYDELKSFISNDSRFEVLIKPVGNWGGNNNVEKLNLLSTREIITQNMLRHFSLLIDRKIEIYNFTELLPMHSICYAAYPDSYVFRSNGDICKCTVYFDLPENTIGKIISENEIYINEKLANLWVTDELEKKCFACKHMLACFNKSCPAKRIKSGISYAKTCSPFF